LEAGAAILATAFLLKAGMWPLCFWLPTTYAAASPPVAAIFAIMTKVGAYIVLRLWLLLFGDAAGASAHFGGDVLLLGGLATIAFGAIGTLASQDLARLTAYSVLVSSGTVLAAIGMGEAGVTGGALFYMVSSTLGLGALFLLVELVERARQVEVAPPLLDRGDGSLPFLVDGEPRPDVNLDDDEEALIGRAVPGALAFLGLAFLACTLVVAGLPPLSGFVGKVAMMSALLDVPHAGAAVGGTAARWSLFGLLVVSGLLSSIALMRIGIRQFWAPQSRPAPRLRVVECAPIGLLLGACVLLVVRGEPALRYLRDTAEALHRPDRYIDSVRAARPVARPLEARR
jgi:multicomponent K+:H+ antiporter subunit D